MSLPTFLVDDVEYVSIRDIKQQYPAQCAKYRSFEKLTKALRFTGYIMVNIVKGEITRTNSLVGSKTKTILVPADQIHRLEDPEPEQVSPAAQEPVPSVESKPLPPIIEDADLQFKDVDGTVLEITMRGERTPQGIFFSVEDLEVAFGMSRLDKHLLRIESGYITEKHYHRFRSSASNPEAIGTKRANSFQLLYLTFAGLLRLVSNSSNKVAKRFGEWMCDIVFAAWFGTTEQRVQVSAKILDVGIEQLAAIMGKCANNIACIYLIDIKRENDGRCVYKYGRTNSIRRRFREHTKTYGDDIELVKFGFIPASDCVKAESDLRNFVKDFTYSGNEDLADKVELIQLNKEELNQTINQMMEISDAASGNMHEQLAIYEVKLKDKDHELTEARHQLVLKDKDITLLEAKSQHQLELKDKDIALLEARHQAELKDKDIALIRAEHRAAQAESELKILRLQLELDQLKGH